MNIKFNYQIDKSTYEDIYRCHLKYKFRLHSSMYLSVVLYLFGLLMEYKVGMDFGFINMLVFWVMVAAIVMNFFADFYLSKKAYANLVTRELSQGTLKINSVGISITQGKLESKFKWDDFDSYLELKSSFLLYKRDNFHIVPKRFDSNDIDTFRNLLNEHIIKHRFMK